MNAVHACQAGGLAPVLFIYLFALFICFIFFFQPTLRHLLDLKTTFEDATCCWITG